MANFLLYVSCCLLLFSLSWSGSAGLPLRVLDAETTAHCQSLFRSLLLNTSGLFHNDVLCLGIPADKVAVRSKADTVSACAPIQTQNSNCGIQRKSSFNKSECLRNILKDLVHYEAAIRSYPTSTFRRGKEEDALLRPTLGIIQSLRKDCFLELSEESDSSKEDAADLTWSDDSFSNRQEMCKMMRGFHIRSITINRAMGYISSGDF